MSFYHNFKHFTGPTKSFQTTRRKKKGVVKVKHQHINKYQDDSLCLTIPEDSQRYFSLDHFSNDDDVLTNEETIGQIKFIFSQSKILVKHLRKDNEMVVLKRDGAQCAFAKDQLQFILGYLREKEKFLKCELQKFDRLSQLEEKAFEKLRILIEGNFTENELEPDWRETFIRRFNDQK